MSQIILAHRDRFYGCSSSEELLRAALLSRIDGTPVSLADAHLLDGVGQRLMMEICTAPKLGSADPAWRDLLDDLRLGGIPGEVMR